MYANVKVDGISTPCVKHRYPAQDPKISWHPALHLQVLEMENHLLRKDALSGLSDFQLAEVVHQDGPRTRSCKI